MKFFRTFKVFLKLAWQAEARYLLALLFFTALSGILPSLAVWSNAHLIDRLAQTLSGQQLAEHAFLSLDFFTKDLFRNGIVFFLIVFAVLRLADQVIGPSRSSLENVYRLRFAQHLQLLITKKASSLDLANFEDPSFSNQLTQVSDQAGHRPYQMVSQSMVIFSSLFALLTMFVVSWQHVWVLPLLALSSLLLFRINFYFSRQRLEFTLKNTPQQRRALYYKTLLTMDRFAKELRLLSLQDHFFMIYRTLLGTLFRKEKDLVKRSLWATVAVQLLLALLPIGLVIYGVHQVLQGLLSLGGFILFSQVIFQIQFVTLQLMNGFSQLAEHSMFSDMILTFFREEPKVERKRHTPYKVRQLPLLEFDQVSFTYPDHTAATLSNLSFSISPGEKVALVGMNGAGKTTIVKLLAGLYETSQGQIRLDGRDIRQLERKELRRQLSIMFQDFNTYHLPLRNNVVLGSMARFADQQWLDTIATRVGLDDLVTKMPEGYDTVLERFIDRGYELSGGQKQMVALSRALFRNAPILVLDEPTAAMDALAEEHFFEDLLNRPVNEKQTILFISHRFSTIRRAERIIVLGKGQMIEEGSHEHLMKQDGLYAQMYSAQARFFADQNV